MLGFVIPTVGRWGALSGLLSSLADAAAAGCDFCVVVVHQGSQYPGAAGQQTLDDFADRMRLCLVQDAGRGASRARNAGLAALDATVTHVVWPNDHTSYPVSSLLRLQRACEQADVVVGTLREGRDIRYRVPAGDSGLDKTNVWLAIEPVTAISRPLLVGAGGWSEEFGAGSLSPWQSSALAELLLRLGQGPRVCWDPEFVADGAGFVRGATGPALRAKARSYGRGYGRVLSAYGYPWRRRLGSIVKPIVTPNYRIGPDRLPVSARAAAALGRAEGVSGRLFPRSASDLRKPAELIAH